MAEIPCIHKAQHLWLAVPGALPCPPVGDINRRGVHRAVALAHVKVGELAVVLPGAHQVLVLRDGTWKCGVDDGRRSKSPAPSIHLNHLGIRVHLAAKHLAAKHLAAYQRCFAALALRLNLVAQIWLVGRISYSGVLGLFTSHT